MEPTADESKRRATAATEEKDLATFLVKNKDVLRCVIQWLPFHTARLVCKEWRDLVERYDPLAGPSFRRQFGIHLAANYGTMIPSAHIQIMKDFCHRLGAQHHIVYVHIIDQGCMACAMRKPTILSELCPKRHEDGPPRMLCVHNELISGSQLYDGWNRPLKLRRALFQALFRTCAHEDSALCDDDCMKDAMFQALRHCGTEQYQLYFASKGEDRKEPQQLPMPERVEFLTSRGPVDLVGMGVRTLVVSALTSTTDGLKWAYPQLKEIVLAVRPGQPVWLESTASRMWNRFTSPAGLQWKIRPTPEASLLYKDLYGRYPPEKHYPPHPPLERTSCREVYDYRQL